MNDPIADMIVRMKNASSARKESVTFTSSKLKLAVLDVLLKEGYIQSFGKKGKKVVKYIDVVLKYDEHGTPVISGVEKISRGSKRVYIKVGDIRKIRNGFGSLILSTSKGIMTGESARKEGLGGEAMFSIW